MKKISNPLKHFALALAAGVAVLFGTGQTTNAATSTTVINLGDQGSGTAIGGQAKVLKIAQGNLPAGSILRSVAISARVDVGDPYCGDICVFVADSAGANGVLLVGDYDTDSAPALAATTSVRWNAGNAYGVGTTVNTTITTGIPAIDLNSSAVFLTSAYGGTWSGSITLTYDGPAPSGIAQRGTATTATGTGTSLTINKPTDVVSGDVMIVSIAQAIASSSAATSSGWTLIKNGALGGTTTSRYGTLLYKVAGASEPGSYTFTLTPSVNGAVGAIVAYSGVNPASPLDAVGASFTVVNNAAVTAATINTVSPNALAIMFGLATTTASGTGGTWGSWASGLTEVYDFQGSGTVANATSVGAASKTIATAGATGGGTATLSVSMRNGGYWVALKASTPADKDFATFGPGATINTVAATVAWTVPAGTDVTTLAPIFTHDGVSVSTASGTARNFTTPQTYIITAADASTKEYTVTVTVSPLPVVSGLVVWVKADAVNTGDANQVRTSGADTFVKLWNDQSGAGRNATNALDADQPKYIASALNGKPAIRFTEDDSNNGDRLYLGDLSAQTPSAGSVFVVATPDEAATRTGYTLFDNRNNDGRWISGPNQYNESTPGTFRQNRDGSFSTDPIKAAWPTSGSHVFALESSSSVYRYLIDGTALPAGTAEYNSGSGQSWTIGNRAQGGGGGSQFNGDIAEVVIFGRVLTPTEANAMGGYLAGKYGVTTTTYPIAAPAAPADLTATPAAGAVDLSWTAAATATIYNVQRSTSSGSGYAPIGTATGTTYSDTTGAAATTYYYIVTAQNSGGTSPVSNEASAARITSSAKDILAFGPGATITGTAIAWTVPQGTVVSALLPTYTLSPFAIGSPVSGTERDFTTPQTYTITAEDNSTQDYIVTVIVEPGVPITDGLIVWLKAGAVNTSDANQVRVVGADTFVKQWNDQSGGGRNASNTTEGDQPKYIANALNGKPVLRFAKSDDNTGSELKLGDLSAFFTNTAGSMFAVATVDTTTYNLFGNRDNDERWVNSQWNESHPGAFRGGRAEGSFNRGAWPTSGSHIFALESSSSVFRVMKDGAVIGSDSADFNNGSGQNWTIGDRADGGGQQFGGDIPEFILYNRVLTADEVNAVGLYLANKYGVTTSYLPPPVTPVAPTDLTATPAAGAVNLSWTASAGATIYNVQRSIESGTGYAAIGTATGTSYSDSTAALGTTYFYVVTAQNGAGTSPVSNEASAARLMSSAKDILAFGPGAIITGTDIAWSVPPGTSVTALAPTYTVSPLASGNPVPATSRNFSTPQTYTVKAEDNSTQDYTVTVTVAAAVPTVTTLNVSVSGTGADIANSGTFVVANHFGGSGMQAAAPVTLNNGLTFGTSLTGMTDNWAQPGSFTPANSTTSDGHGKVPLLTDANFMALMRNYFWISYGNSVSWLDIPDLMVGHDYRLQLISPNPENCSVTVEGGSPVTWSGTDPSVLTYYWTAADTTANVILTRTGGEIDFTGYAVHDITPVTAPVDQTITFDVLAAKTYGDAPFALTATASSGLTVSYTSSDPTVASVSSGTVTILKAGTTIITASQSGNGSYNAAPSVDQTLTVNLGTPVYQAPFAAGVMVTMVVNARGESAPASPVSGPAGNASNWNYPNPVLSDNGQDATGTALVDSAGAATGVGFNLHMPSNDPWGTPALEMLKTGMHNPGWSDWGQCEINGLTPGSSYTLYIASARINENERSKGTFRTTNAADSQTAAVDCSKDPSTGETWSENSGGPRNGITWVEGNNYVAFRNVIANADGKILFTANEDCAPHLVINGFQLVSAGVALPEATAITYGQPLSASTLAGTFVNAAGATVPGTLAFTTPTATPDAGTASQSVAFTPEDMANYNTGIASVSVTVNQASQTIAFGSLEDKIFATPAFDLTATASSGLMVSYTSSDETVASVLDGTVTILKVGSTTITASQSGNGNYTAATPVEQTLTVNPKGVTITGVSAADKPYDGNDTAALSGGSVSGTVGLDVVTVVAGGGAFDGVNVGTHAVTATGYSLDGADAGNYTLSAQPVVVDASINPKGVTITGVSAADKPYDGNNTATLSGGIVSDTVGTEDVTMVAGSGTFASVDVGTHAVTASGYSLGGTAAGNYTLLAQPTVPDASIIASIPTPILTSIERNGEVLTLKGTLDFNGKLVVERTLSLQPIDWFPIQTNDITTSPDFSIPVTRDAEVKAFYRVGGTR